MVRLTDRPDMTLDVYRGRNTTTTNRADCISGHSRWRKALSCNQIKTYSTEAARTVSMLCVAPGPSCSKRP